MKLKVFVDTNILLSGIFFEGNEAKILDLVERARRLRYHEDLKEE